MPLVNNSFRRRYGIGEKVAVGRSLPIKVVRGIHLSGLPRVEDSSRLTMVHRFKAHHGRHWVACVGKAPTATGCIQPRSDIHSMQTGPGPQS